MLKKVPAIYKPCVLYVFTIKENLLYNDQVNIKSYANNNELAVMPQDRVARLEWDRHYLSVLGVENNQLYVLRLQVPEKVFVEEESDLRQILDSFRVNKVIA